MTNVEHLTAVMMLTKEYRNKSQLEVLFSYGIESSWIPINIQIKQRMIRNAWAQWSESLQN